MYVTGLPNSGTTYVAHVLAETGMDTGEPVHWSSPKKGLEWVPLRNYNAALIQHLIGDLELMPGATKVNESKRLEWVRANPIPGDIPKLVKVPDYGITRLYEFVDVGPVVLVVRPVEGWVTSMMSQRPTVNQRFTRDQLGVEYQRAVNRMMLDADLVVEFPRAVFDVEYFSAAVGVDVSEAHEKVTDESFVSV